MKTSDPHQQFPASSTRSKQPFFGATPEQAFFVKERSRPEPFFKPAARSSIPIQTKLTVGAAGDHYEQEADRVAAQVVDRINSPSVQQTENHPSVQRLREEGELQREVEPEEDALQMKSFLQREVEPEEDAELQMHPISTTIQRVGTDGEDLQRAVEQDITKGGMASPDLETSIQQSRGSGQPIAEQVREPMEQAFGADFSGVRVHTDAQSDQINRSIQAKAFTTGQDVFFRQGTYQPDSHGGQELIAHELTHVMQQNGQAVQRSTEANSNRISMTGRRTPLNFLFTSPVIQRTIYRYRGDGKWSIAQRGTKGNREPQEPFEEGEYFNDVTGERGKTLESVSAGLVDYMMMTGSIKDIMQTNKKWIDVADALGQEAESRLMLENKALKRKKNDDYVLYAGFFKLRWKNGKTAISFLSRITNKDLLKKAALFVFEFMRANGQLGYIEQQDWYRNGSASVLVDLNFYYKRPMGDEGIDLHKDTGGDNLFVNIIFNNPNKTPATEWTQDKEEATGYKKKQMERLMPEEMLEAINEAKAALRKGTGAGGSEQIEGATMPSYGYVSWVDELILHSTPSLANRMSYETLAQSKNFQNAPTYLQALLEQYGTSRATYEVMVILSETDGTLMNILRQNFDADREFTHNFWITLYNILYKKESESDDFRKQLIGYLIDLCNARFNVLEPRERFDDAREMLKAWLVGDIKNYSWEDEKLSGSTVNEIAAEESVGTGSENIPSNTKSRPRANSNPKVLKKVQAAAAAQEQRSFLRSWVRVVKNENESKIYQNVKATAQKDLATEQGLKSRLENDEKSGSEILQDGEENSKESEGQTVSQHEEQNQENTEEDKDV